jgi:hypothetical protein
VGDLAGDLRPPCRSPPAFFRQQLLRDRRELLGDAGDGAGRQRRLASAFEPERTKVARTEAKTTPIAAPSEISPPA